MMDNLKIRDNGVSRLIGRLAAEKKKSVMALCLVILMVFMWVKVLCNKTPQTTEAALVAQGGPADQLSSELKISFIELPNVKGRNDVLTRDFFTVDNWQNFFVGGEGENSNGVEKVNVSSGDSSEEAVRQVAEKLKLEAISLGGVPKAFINNKLLSVGDKLFVGDGVNTYECEVIGIEENMVLVRCGVAEIQLKLTYGNE